jgi:hypothetical protein
MKSVGHDSYSGGHDFNQLPIPNDIPPPFKPLSNYPSHNSPFESTKLSQYGPPNYYSDYSAQSSNRKPISVNPKAYDIYHSMKIKANNGKNFVTLPTVVDRSKGLEIQKSIEYEIKA